MNASELKTASSFLRLAAKPNTFFETRVQAPVSQHAALWAGLAAAWVLAASAMLALGQAAEEDPVPTVNAPVQVQPMSNLDPIQATKTRRPL